MRGGVIIALISAPVFSKFNQYPLRFLWGPNRIPNVVLGILIFIRVIRSDIHIPKWIRFFSVSVFDVYLIHNGPLFSTIIELLRLNKISHEKVFYPLLIIMNSFLIFGYGSIIAHIRIFLFDKLKNERFKIFIYKRIELYEKNANDLVKKIFFKFFEYRNHF